MEAKGVALGKGYPATAALEEAASLRRSNANVRGEVQESSQVNLVGTRAQISVDFDTVLSPLSIFYKWRLSRLCGSPTQCWSRNTIQVYNEKVSNRQSGNAPALILNMYWNLRWKQDNLSKFPIWHIDISNSIKTKIFEFNSSTRSSMINDFGFTWGCIFI